MPIFVLKSLVRVRIQCGLPISIKGFVLDLQLQRSDVHLLNMGTDYSFRFMIKFFKNFTFYFIFEFRYCL